MVTEIDSYTDDNCKKLQPIRIEIERLDDKKYLLMLPTGKEITLPTFKMVEETIEFFQKKAQFRNQAFILLDRNTKTEWNDFRIFTEYLEACHERIRFKASVRKHRLGNRKYFPRKVKKIDSKVLRPYERTW